MYYPQLKRKAAQQAVTSVFGGINRDKTIADGQFAKALNLSTREYPMMCPRKPRGIGGTINGTYRGMMEKNGQMVTIVGNRVEYGGEAVEGIVLSEAADMLPKRMVGMGAYVLIFPDKVYFNSVDLADRGSMEARYQSAGNVTYTMCRLDGTDYENVTISDEEPEEPENGAYWIDTASTPHQLMVYNGLDGYWEPIYTVYTRIEAANIGQAFSAGDVVEISGAAVDEHEAISTLNGSQYIYGVGQNWITVLGVLDEIVTQTEGAVKVERTCPDMDFVLEDSNRIWGCRYGKDADGKALNEIYACKLGDFRNWRVYQGISTDSYTVSVGSDGPFTGAISYGGMPMFFKADCVHKIYGSQPRNYQVMTTQMHGVQAGSEKSLTIVDGVLYYLSDYGVEAYDGSMPVRVSQPLGDGAMSGGIAGAIGSIFYIAMREADGEHLYVYDTRLNIWHEEDVDGALAFEPMGSDLYMLHASRIDTMLGSAGTLEETVHWSAETGLQGWETQRTGGRGAADAKYITRYNIRAIMPRDSRMTVKIQYDSEGFWHKKLEMENFREQTNTVLMPVYPKRCDHIRMRMEGEGEIMVHSIIRLIAGGGDGKRGKI